MEPTKPPGEGSLGRSAALLYAGLRAVDLHDRATAERMLEQLAHEGRDTDYRLLAEVLTEVPR